MSKIENRFKVHFPPTCETGINDGYDPMPSPYKLPSDSCYTPRDVMRWQNKECLLFARARAIAVEWLSNINGENDVLQLAFTKHRKKLVVITSCLSDPERSHQLEKSCGIFQALFPWRFRIEVVPSGMMNSKVLKCNDLYRRKKSHTTSQ